VQEIARFCKARDILLLIDEVQTGVGRTGSLFCFQQYGINPDAVTFAKGIAAGLPFGGVLAAKSCADTLCAGTHATTFGGNPICAAGANAVLAELTSDFLSEVTQKGAYIRETVAGWDLPVVTNVRGLGLMIGIGVSCSHREAVAKLVESGLLALTAGADTIRLMPPLTITKDEIDAGLAILKTILSAY
jgi:acetylornithine/N-succinyldiaminopimelate aminotransferase